jgi:two-component system sensor histidine kinase TctE
VRAEGEDAVLTVRDCGPGISSELRQRLFAPFSAGSASSGSGLGLAICREIVLALGGRISLDNRSEPDAQSGAEQVIGLDAVVHLPLSGHNS